MCILLYVGLTDWSNYLWLRSREKFGDWNISIKPSCDNFKHLVQIFIHCSTPEGVKLVSQMLLFFSTLFSYFWFYFMFDCVT